jgi:hypothetical protein
MGYPTPMKLLPLFVLIASLCGCMNMHKVVKELKNDPATVDLQIMVPMYGSMIFHRSFPTNYVQPKP